MHKDGKSSRQIAECVGKSVSIVHYIIKESKTEDTVANKQRKGRPNKLSAREQKIVFCEIKKDLKISVPKLVLIITLEKMYILNYVAEYSEKITFMVE